MTAQIPISMNSVPSNYIDQQILRQAVSAEYDAISLYEQMGWTATDPRVKTVLNDIAKEEKTHVGEFSTVLEMLDTEQASESVKGKEEVMTLLRIPAKSGTTYVPVGTGFGYGYGRGYNRRMY